MEEGALSLIRLAGLALLCLPGDVTVRQEPPPSSSATSFAGRLEAHLEGQATFERVLALVSEAVTSILARNGEGIPLPTGEHSLRGVVDSYSRWPVMHCSDGKWTLFIMDRQRFECVFRLVEREGEVRPADWSALFGLMELADGGTAPALLDDASGDVEVYGGNEPYYLVLDCQQNNAIASMVAFVVPSLSGEKPSYKLSVNYEMRLVEGNDTPIVVVHEADDEILTSDSYGKHGHIVQALGGDRRLAWAHKLRRSYSVVFRAGEAEDSCLRVSARVKESD